MEDRSKHIDQHFQERLHDYAPPPPAFVWENLERALHRRRRRLVFWWWLGAGLSLAGLLIGWWHWSPKPHVPDHQVSVAPSVASSDAPKAASPALPQPAAPVATTATHSMPPVAGSIEKTGKTTGRPAISQAAPETNPATTIHHIRSETPEAEPQTILPGVQDKDAEFALSVLPPGSGIGSLPSFQRTPGLNDLLAKAWAKPAQAPEAKKPARKPVKNCYDFSKHPRVWMIEAYGGPSLAQRELVAAPDSRPYLNKRLNSERPDLAFNAGLRAALMLRGNVLLRTGIQYDQFTEVFEHIDPEYVKYIVEIVNIGGVTTVDTVGVEYGEKYLKTYNRFGLLDIPLTGGFELRKGRSGFNINAGVTFNLVFWKRGAILSPDTGEPAWFSPSARKPGIEVFRPRSGVSATAAIQWFYHLKPRTRVFVEPYFRQILKPVSVGAHPVRQRYGIGGLRLGLAHIL